MKRKPISTSQDAYRSLNATQIRETYERIIKALEVLGQASTEQISSHLTCDHGKIHKRVSEMERMKIIYRPGHRVPTKSGRTAFVWCLTSAGVKTEREKAIPGRSIVDFSKTIQQIQNNLF